MQSKNMTIGALAKQASVNVETIRYYQRRGLLRTPERPLGGIRRYDETDLRRLAFIRSAQRLGFSLDQISSLLELEDGTDCRKAAEVGQTRLQDLQAKISDMQQMADALQAMLQACNSREQNIRCPLIEALRP